MRRQGRGRGTDDEIARYRAAYNQYTIDAAAPGWTLSVGGLCALNAAIGGAGEIRRGGVKVGGFWDFPRHSALRRFVEEAVAEFGTATEHGAAAALRLHLRIVTLHPFTDGNGRTARLAGSVALAAHGYRSTLLVALEEIVAGSSLRYLAIGDRYWMGELTEDGCVAELLELVAERSEEAAAFRAFEDRHGVVAARRLMDTISPHRRSDLNHQLRRIEAEERPVRQSVPIAELTAEQIRDAVKSCVAHLVSLVRPDGSFVYRYRPEQDTTEDRVHLVRFAGCAYALARAEAAGIAGDVAVRESAVSALDFLLGHLETRPAPGRGLATRTFIAEPAPRGSRAKLGAAALTALALQFPVGDGYSGVYRSLIATLVGAQHSNGKFSCDLAGGEERPNAQEYFPGETLLALTRHVEKNPSQGVAGTIGAALGFYRGWFAHRPTTAFVVWQAEAWTRVALRGLRTGEISPVDPSEAAAFVFEQLDWLLGFQHGLGSMPLRHVGGFVAPSAPTSGTAAYVEALTAGCLAAQALGDEFRAIRYRRAAVAGLGFLLRLQLTESRARGFPRPRRSEGGMPHSFDRADIRCDADQHFITCGLAVLDASLLH